VLLERVRDGLMRFRADMLFGMLGRTTIVMATHNNKDVLNVTLEDLSDKDRQTITQATEEFRDKCLLSFGKVRDKVVQKSPLPKVLIHWQSDTDQADERRFHIDAVHKVVHEALTNHNTAFLNTFYNSRKEVFQGAPIVPLLETGNSLSVRNRQGNTKYRQEN
jgi:hypothetical protein